jgi:hypothetical protein
MPPRFPPRSGSGQTGWWPEPTMDPGSLVGSPRLHRRQECAHWVHASVGTTGDSKDNAMVSSPAGSRPGRRDKGPRWLRSARPRPAPAAVGRVQARR